MKTSEHRARSRTDVGDTGIHRCKVETDFHDDTTFHYDDEGRVVVESDHTNGLFDMAEWKALRNSPWIVVYSNADRVVLKRDG